MEDCPDRGTIEGALAAPRAGWEEQELFPTLEEKAAVLAYHFAKSQACPDGNKRIALIVLVEFLYTNGRTLDRDPDGVIEKAAGSNPEDRDAMIGFLTEWIREALIPLPGETRG